MYSPLLICFVALLSWAPCRTQAQESTRHPRRLLVSHLSAENKALMRRPAAPRHNIFTRVLCFKVKCTSYVGWRRKQRSMRFKGYRDGGKVPRPAKEPMKPDDAPVVFKDTISKSGAPPSATDALPAEARIFVLDEVLFELNSARFNEKFVFRLDSLVQLLKVHKNLRARISGHTDDTGNSSYNLKLSNDRAAAVATYLVNNNISPDRISYEGMGSSRPIADNGTEAGRQKNRRVEILLSE